MEAQTKKGTTTVGIVCKDAVVLAADQLASMGDFKYSKKARKLYKIAQNIMITTSGTVGDNLAIVRLLQAQMRIYELEVGKVSVKAAVTFLANVLSEKYSHTYLPYGVFDLIGGYDTAPRLYSVDPVGGVHEEEYAATGSGLVVAYGILDKGFKKNLSVKEGIKLAVESIVAARERVASVGGEGIMVAVIDKKGIHEVPEEEINALIKAK